MNQLKFVKSWFPFGTADPSPDFFNACALNNVMGCPKNIFGEQTARTGDSYVGLIAYLTSKSGRGWKVPANHREFVMAQLTKPLVKGHQYYGEFWVNLADNCEFAIDQLGIYFSEDMPGFDWRAMDLGYYQPQIQSDSGTILSDNNDWVKISGTFTAKGDELSLCIGVFQPDRKLTIKKTRRKFNAGRDKKLPKSLQPQIAYYFIDDVLVRPVDPSESLYPIEVAQLTRETDYFGPVEVGKKFTLKDIYFEFDQARLLRSSFFELNKLYNYLRRHRMIKIQIEGHTDNVGSREYNQKLSAARAKSVMEYLVSKGINEFRIDCKGFGSTQPVVPNDSEENRALNRRVEILILEN